jgi:hypothetical protein
MEAPDHPPCLVSLELAVGVEFVLENPLAGNDLSTRGRGTRDHVWLRWRASNSACMAPRQLGSFRASQAERGVGEMDDALLWRAYLGFDLKMSALARVTMECCCGGGAAAAGAGDGALTGRHAGGEWVAGGAGEWCWGGG